MASAAWVRQSAATLLRQHSRLRHRHHGVVGEAEEKSDETEHEEKPRLSSVTRIRRKVRLGRRWRLVALLILPFPMLFQWIFRPLKIKYFGDHDIEGGQWGAKIDRRNRRFHRRRIEMKRKSWLRALGIVVPLLDNVRNEMYLTVTSDILARRAERKRRLQEAEQFVEKRQLNCQSLPALSQDDFINPIPQHILQPNYGKWFRPREGTSMPVIPFEEHDMRILVSETFPELMTNYDRSAVEEQLLLWSLCALYAYGGHVFGSREIRVGWLVKGIPETRHSCEAVAVAKFLKGEDNLLQLLMLAASPRHPQLKCAISRLEMLMNGSHINDIVESLFSPEAWKSSTTRLAIESHDQPLLSDVICSHCSALQPSTCCDNAKLSSRRNMNSKGNQGMIEVRTFVEVYPRRQLRIGERGSSSLPTVTISERPDTPAPVTYLKSSIRDVMKASNCIAGWRCHRCLHNPVYGTYEKCSSVCNECFTDLICSDRNQRHRNEVFFDVIINGIHNGESNKQRIPRVVHQTWPGDLSLDHFPQLSRVQSSWKNAGWEYRFYTDTDARDYIDRNFPSRFLNAYDSLVPGAFKVRRL